MKSPADNQNRRFAVPDRILLATDLEDALLPHAIAQAKASEATLTIAHVIPSAETVAIDARAVFSVDVAAMKQEAIQALEPMAARVRDSGVACDIVVRQGTPQEAVPELVKEIKADRLILGTHGRRHIKKLLLGSVAQEILGKVDVPVCTIGPKVQAESAHGRPRKILHPVSLRPGFEQSARLALEMAQFYQAEITLLHVLDRGLQRDYDPTRIAAWTKAELQRLIPDEAPLWTYVNAQVEVGGVVDHVLNVAAEMQADLIVLGTDVSGAFWPVRGDSTAYEIVAQAGCPVLTLRHGAAVEQESGATTSVFAATF